MQPTLVVSLKLSQFLAPLLDNVAMGAYCISSRSGPAGAAALHYDSIYESLMILLLIDHCKLWKFNIFMHAVA